MSVIKRQRIEPERAVENAEPELKDRVGEVKEKRGAKRDLNAQLCIARIANDVFVVVFEMLYKFDRSGDPYADQSQRVRRESVACVGGDRFGIEYGQRADK